jgi:predicted P-loop ATPase
MNEIRWKGEETFRSITDRDESTLWRRMNRGERPVRFNDLRLVLSSEYVPFFSPFKDYFYQLPKWQEGDADYIRRLADTVTLANSSPEARATFERCLKKWLVAMVAGFLSDRVNHEILVLIGRQGIYKTTWFHYLLPPELRTYYVAKTNTRRMSKDDRLLMAESGLICLEEIVTMTDEEVDQIKAAASLPQVVERAAYARNKEVRPHLASFCGTGNHVQFLTDTSGNRRWLPFEVTDILSPYDHPIDYTGLYAQVMHLWQSGFPYWFDPEEIRSLARHVSRFEAPNLEEEQIRKHFRIPQPGEAYEVYSVADVLGVINLELKTQLSATKVGMLLNKMGFKKVRKDNRRGYMVYRYSLEEISSNRKGTIKDAEEQELPF